MMKGMHGQPKAIVVGGSIAGISCAHALTAAGWEVAVLEKSAGPSTGSSPTGAGLGLDPLSCKIISSWIGGSSTLLKSTMPLTIDQNQATDAESKTNRILTRDEDFNFRASHWADLHGLLLSALKPEVILWGHQCQSFSIADDKGSVTVKAKVIQTGEIDEIVGDLLVAADGCLSLIRRTFLPNHTLRYTGYCAWRGVLDFTGNENSETIKGLRKAYPDLGKCLYFDLGSQTHCVLYELLNKRMNWIWYINQPEPETKGTSVTMKVSKEMIKKMQDDAEKYWVPELVALIKATEEPFLNVIYDSDPLDKIFWDNVVLVGDAAHPTTPHCLRSTNMSLLDAAVLGPNDLQSALTEYQSARLPVVAKQVLHARRVGRIKQGLRVPDREPFDPKSASVEDCCELQQKNEVSRKIEGKMMNSEKMKLPQPKAVIVGGSIAGVSCAHALLRAGWEVVVLDKSSGLQVGSPSGAGIGLDPLSCAIIESWLGDAEPLNKVTVPLTIDQEEELDDCTSVTVKARVLQTGNITEITADLLVGADGSLSSVRRTLLPDQQLRYAGYCAWRGVLDYSKNDHSDTIKGIQKVYPDLGKRLYFDLGACTHCVLYEVPGKRMNWVWYVNQTEPDKKGKSLTMKPDKVAIEIMRSKAEKVCLPGLARLIRETEDPFMNLIYDSDPLEQVFWDNVVLVGDAAHPITHHSSRSTNAAILDAFTLGKCLEKHQGVQSLRLALSEYQSIRLPVMAKQVLHSRRVGQIRQGLAFSGPDPFDCTKVSQDVKDYTQQRSTPYFECSPDFLDLQILI